MVESTESTLKYWAWDKLKTSPKDSSRTFTVVQWNVLNSELADAKGFPKVDEKYTCWEYRHDLIKKFISTLPADFFCFEEVNTKTVEAYTKIFETIGLKVKFYPKSSNFEGLLVAYNEEKWKLVDEVSQLYKELDGKTMTQIMASLIFKNANTDDYFQLAATHLKAKHEFEESRYIQVIQLVELFQNSKKNYEEKNRVKVHSVLVGDFNAEPDWKSVKYVAENSGLNSAFADAVLTTLKIRDKEYCRVIDYIFHDASLKVTGRNAIPAREEFGVNGLPNESFPSDHFFLLAQFEY